MLAFVLFHNVTCYTTSLFTTVHRVNTTKLLQYHVHFRCHEHDITEFRVVYLVNYVVLMGHEYEWVELGSHLDESYDVGGRLTRSMWWVLCLWLYISSIVLLWSGKKHGGKWCQSWRQKDMWGHFTHGDWRPVTVPFYDLSLVEKVQTVKFHFTLESERPKGPKNWSWMKCLHGFLHDKL